FADLLELARVHGLATVAVLMPEGSAMRALYAPAVREDLDRFLAEELPRHGTPLIDARTWLPDDYLFDAHHPLAHGAACFSAELGRAAADSLRSPPGGSAP